MKLKTPNQFAGNDNALNYVEETAFADDLEMIEMLNNKELLSMLKQGSKDAKEKRKIC